MTAPRKHSTGWEDGGIASLEACGDVRINGAQVLHTDDIIVCQVCGAHLRLVWNVYAEEVPTPEQMDDLRKALVPDE